MALLLFIAEAHAPTTVLGLLGVGALVGAGFAWRDAGHDLPVAAIVIAGRDPRRLHRLRQPQGARRPPREPVRTGSEELVGAIAEVREPLDPEGQVFVAGRALAGSRDRPRAHDRPRQ